MEGWVHENVRWIYLVDGASPISVNGPVYLSDSGNWIKVFDDQRRLSGRMIPRNRIDRIIFAPKGGTPE